MSLGENIYNLRKSKNLSQDELAQVLGVSRQSVSKWETNTAIPELDKLVKMSEVFGVTLDELVSGIQTAPQEAAAAEPAAARKHPACKTTGWILFAAGLVTLLLLSLLGGVLLGLIFSAPLLVPGVICLVAKTRVGLKCAWAEFLMIASFLSFTTGTNWTTPFAYIRMWEFFVEHGNIFHLIVSTVELLLLLGLWIWTVKSYNRERKPLSRRGMLILALGWGLYLLSKLPYELPIDPLARIYALTVNLINFSRLGLLTVLLVFTWRLPWLHRREKI